VTVTEGGDEVDEDDEFLLKYQSAKPPITRSSRITPMMIAPV
jgi:hypothetical protein